MCFFFSLIPATIWVVLGYFILYSSTKTQGTVQRFGHFFGYLGVRCCRVVPGNGRLCNAYGPLSFNRNHDQVKAFPAIETDRFIGWSLCRSATHLSPTPGNIRPALTQRSLRTRPRSPAASAPAAFSEAR